MKSGLIFIAASAAVVVALGAVTIPGPGATSVASEAIAAATGPTGPTGPVINGDMVLNPKTTQIVIIDQQSTDPMTMAPVDETSVKVAAGFTCKSDCTSDLTTTALAHGFFRVGVQPAGFCTQVLPGPGPVPMLLRGNPPVVIPGNEIQSIAARKGPASLWFTGLVGGLAAVPAPADALGVSAGPGFANFSLSFAHKGGQFSLDSTEDVTGLPLPASAATVMVDLIVGYPDTASDSDSGVSPQGSEFAQGVPLPTQDVACETVTAQIVRIQIGTPL